MSFRLEMLQVARLAPKALGEASDLVRSFLLSRLGDDGGFLDREDRPDIYYTVFGIEGLLALQADMPRQRIAAWLRGHGRGETMDFVHLCCLARCWSALDPKALSPEDRQAMVQRLETWHCPDGGYHPAAGRSQGSAYGCLLATAAYEDLGLALPDPDEIRRCMDRLICPAGGWTNEAFLPLANAPGTAAAMALYRRMGWPVPTLCSDWLLSCASPEGGFKAIPAAPIPDLLSTAVALHALSGAQIDFSKLKEPALDYIDTLWSAEGGFHGNWTDNVLDCEYTYYGLLALGHLSL
jgi:Prenyltransferase and squalene oxidase repeat